MIIVTGGAGFIGSALIWELNRRGVSDIIVVDHLGTAEKWKNLVPLHFNDYIEKDVFIEKAISSVLKHKIEAVLHMGACSSTTEHDASYLIQNNFEYTKRLCAACMRKNIRFIYASSAATYGDGSFGYSDDESQLEWLRPLNMYGYSKHLFDLWAQRHKLLGKITGLKFFNIFGPNEYHKEDMRSMVIKAVEQIRSTGAVRLFKSDKAQYKDGEQVRDFLYVKDAVELSLFFLDNPQVSGIFNIGSGKASTWNELAEAVFSAMGTKKNIIYIDMPEPLKDKYQYHTMADISKLRRAGCGLKVTPLEEAVRDYVANYLLTGSRLEP